MRRFSSAMAVLLVTAIIPSAASAQSRPTSEPTSRPVTVDLKDAAAVKAAMRSEVIVSGTVANAEWSGTGRVMRIEFVGTEKSRFYAVIFPPQRPAFDQKYGGDVANALGGKEVRITGKLQLYHERPEIITNRLPQLDVMNKEE